MSFIELMVGLVVSTMVIYSAFAFFKYYTGNIERQKQVENLHAQLRASTDYINHFLVSSGLGVGSDSLFDPNGLLSGTSATRNCPVWQVNDTTGRRDTLLAYGNYAGAVAQLTQPVVNVNVGNLVVDKPGLFQVNSVIYIFAGSTQEAVRVTGISGNTLSVGTRFLAPYPKGTLVLPLERVLIAQVDATTLRVTRMSGTGAEMLRRDYAPSGRPGDSLEFKLYDLNPVHRTLRYRLTLSAKNNGTQGVRLVDTSSQVVYLRSY